jgi:hypothetical protein
VRGVATREHDECHDLTQDASIAVDRVQCWLYRINMKTANTKRNLKAASKKAADAKHNKATDVALAGITEELKKPAAKAPAATVSNGAKPNVRFNNFEKRSTYEAVAQLARTGPKSMKSALDKLKLMGWDKHELELSDAKPSV